MELTQLNMVMDDSEDPSILMVGECIFDHQLVVKEVTLRKNSYGNYYLVFPESNHQRVFHPIQKEFYRYLLTEVSTEFHKKCSILGRSSNRETKGKAVRDSFHG